MSVRALTAAAGAAAALAAAAPAAAAVPSNLCAIDVAPQLRALGVGAACDHVRTPALANARWGGISRGISVNVLLHASRAGFEAQFGPLGVPVALGSFAREQVGPYNVTVTAWAHGVGFSVGLIAEAGSPPSAADRTAVLAFARAIARRL